VRVRELAKAGVDWVKVMATGGGMTPGTNMAAAQFTVDELTALVDEAARLGLRVAAHCHGTPGIANAAAAGVATIEHCSFRNPDGLAWDAEVGKSIAEAGVAVSPTVHSGYLRAREAPYYDERLEIAHGLIDAGCTIIMSTDCGIPNTPHDILPESMAYWGELTETPAVDVLMSATSVSAEVLGLDDRGVLAEGKRADVLVVEGDPLEDLNALQDVRHVFRGGEQVL
jgi:imidazolonepropionase-like amidohydrolase